MRNILVTGGTGCVGSNLAQRLLQQGYNVRILRRQNSDLRAIHGIDVEHRMGDVRDPESLHSAIKGCDTVFHTAAMVTFARSARETQYAVNVTGTRNVVEACLENSVERLVHTSSVAAIGHTATGEPANEKTEGDWSGVRGYAYSKHLAEKEIVSGAARGLHTVIVNPSVVIGERDIHFHGGQLVRDAARGRIPFYIEGGMNIVYVGDVANGQILAAEKGRAGERYILSGENLTHKSIFFRTAALVGGRPPIAKLPIPLLRGAAGVMEVVARALRRDPWLSTDLVANAGRYNYFSHEKAMRELGYATTPFDSAILAAYAWYKDNGFL